MLVILTLRRRGKRMLASCLRLTLSNISKSHVSLKAFGSRFRKFLIIPLKREKWAKTQKVIVNRMTNQLYCREACVT